MDLTGIQREIGLDRLEQKMVMQNDAFIDLARREGLRRSSPEECVVAHGGVFVSAQINSRGALRPRLNHDLHAIDATSNRLTG